MLLEIAISLIAVCLFVLSIWYGKVVGIAERTLGTTIEGVTSMMSREMNDEEKEVVVRRAGINLIISAISLFFRISISLAVAAFPIFLFDRLGWIRSNDVVELMLRIDYLVIVSVLVILAVEVIRRRNYSNKTSDYGKTNHYSSTDRFFHSLAFSSPSVMKTASKIEDGIFSRRLSETESSHYSPSPVFITSLARGGTTTLLNALADIPEIVTHVYRDMPLVTAPILWNRISGGKSRQVSRQQRAHGDGLEIDLDSPEALEEVVWKIYWPEKYRQSSIGLWGIDDHKPEGELFLRRHFMKIACVRMMEHGEHLGRANRYCSKNNTNIARIPYLLETFPDCEIVVPIRRPECHAASLLRQHINFLGIQKEDRFVLEYMSDIGHFEFGLNRKPILFPEFDAGKYDATHGDYWIDYWIHAFRYISEFAERCRLVFQDDLRKNPASTMSSLCQEIGIEASDSKFASHFHSIPDTASTDLYNPILYKQADDLYRMLKTSSR